MGTPYNPEAMLHLPITKTGQHSVFTTFTDPLCLEFINISGRATFALCYVNIQVQMLPS
jgi:hypothetical protein